VCVINLPSVHTNHRIFVILVALAALAGCEAGPLSCDGPAQCHGNACCMDTPIGYGGNGPAVYCTGAPDACRPTVTLNTLTTRVCQTDDDCVAGGISTVWTHCCDATISQHAVKACGGPCGTPGP
jgi:hypothetical protein